MEMEQFRKSIIEKNKIYCEQFGGSEIVDMVVVGEATNDDQVLNDSVSELPSKSVKSANDGSTRLCDQCGEVLLAGDLKKHMKSHQGDFCEHIGFLYFILNKLM